MQKYRICRKYENFCYAPGVIEISPRLQLMYKLSVALCFLFSSLIIALFTLIITDESFVPNSYKAEVLLQDLTSLRAWIVVIGLILFA